MKHFSHLSEVSQWCLTLCDPLDTRLLHPWDFLGKSTGVGCHFLLQGIFPTQGSNPGLPHCRQTLYCLSHQESHLKAEIIHQQQKCTTRNIQGLLSERKKIVAEENHIYTKE